MNILIIAENTLKDIIFLEPAIREVKNKFNNSCIYLICQKRFSSIVNNWEFVDEKIMIPEDLGIFGEWTLISELRKIVFEKILDFRRNSSVFLRKTFLKYNDYFYKCKKTSLLFNEIYHDIMRNAQINFLNTNIKWHFPIGHTCKLGKVKSPLIGIIPFSDKSNVKIEVFLYIVSEFIKKYNGSVVLFGNEKFKRQSKAFDVFDSIFNLIGRHDYNDIAFVGQYCNLVAGVNSDFLYLSQIINKNTIMINNEDKPEFTGIFQLINDNIEKEIISRIDKILIQNQ
ncbi:MAG: hypothetical protein M0R46_16910 [Candidatus Muirbacterium halophilum]|nr:hypothetical protein [Candidatus Muirbacterium halophilum]MCK9477598.1 hypothetical protein [Candidatus Muirbacterium halophilum]